MTYIGIEKSVNLHRSDQVPISYQVSDGNKDIRHVPSIKEIDPQKQNE
jgi:hypothetical protein